MNAAQINQTFDLVGYVSQIVPLKQSQSYLIGPCPMCGGRDRFNLKQTATGAIWVCRHCSKDKYRSALDFLMEFLRVDFKEALKQAGGDLERPARQAATPPSQPKNNRPSDEWQRDAWQHVGAASDALLGIAPDAADPLTSAVVLAGHAQAAISREAREYLTARGISRASWASFQLGYTIAYKRPAISIPYFDGNTITAVKYRFIDTIARQDKGRRFSMLQGSKPFLFGLSHVIPSAKGLLVVEGELNAVSIIQQMPRGLATVSMGSETNTPALLKKLADRYERVFIWMDDRERAQEMQRRMGRDATLIESPIHRGQKYDANLMLQANVLPGFISRKFGTTCQAES